MKHTFTNAYQSIGFPMVESKKKSIWKFGWRNFGCNPFEISINWNIFNFIFFSRDNPFRNVMGRKKMSKNLFRMSRNPFTIFARGEGNAVGQTLLWTFTLAIWNCCHLLYGHYMLSHQSSMTAHQTCHRLPSRSEIVLPNTAKLAWHQRAIEKYYTSSFDCSSFGFG